MEHILIAVGLICFFEGLPYFACPDQLKKWLQRVTTTPSGQLRVLGCLFMLVGLLLVFWGSRYGG